LLGFFVSADAESGKRRRLAKILISQQDFEWSDKKQNLNKRDHPNLVQFIKPQHWQTSQLANSTIVKPHNCQTSQLANLTKGKTHLYKTSPKANLTNGKPH
jgi:hypothetical protein